MKIKGIYSITNTANKKKYIGCSIDISRRWQEHLSQLSNGKHANANLQKDFNKFNNDITKFKFEILEIVEEANTLFDKEQLYINRFYPNVYNTVSNPNLRIFRKLKSIKTNEVLANKLLRLVRLLKHPSIFINITNDDLLEKLDCSLFEIEEMFKTLSVNDFKVHGVVATLEGQSLMLMDMNRREEVESYIEDSYIVDYSNYKEIEFNESDVNLIDIIKGSNIEKFKKARIVKEDEKLAIRLLDLIRVLKYPIVFVDIANGDLYKKLDCSQKELREVLNAISFNTFKINGVIVTLEREVLMLMDANRLKKVKNQMIENYTVDYGDYKEIEIINII